MPPRGEIARQVGGNGRFAAAALGIEYQDTLHSKKYSKIGVIKRSDPLLFSILIVKQVYL